MPDFKVYEPIIEDPNSKVLFFKEEQEESTKNSQYSDFKKVVYDSWSQLYNHLISEYKNRLTFLVDDEENAGLRELKPTIYLEKHLHMR